MLLFMIVQTYKLFLQKRISVLLYTIIGSTFALLRSFTKHSKSSYRENYLMIFPKSTINTFSPIQFLFLRI